jgi:hypothetical protein
VNKNPVELVERWSQQNLVLKIKRLIGSTVVPPLHGAVKPELPSSGSSTENWCGGTTVELKTPMKSAAWLSGSTVPLDPPLFGSLQAVFRMRFHATVHLIGWGQPADRQRSQACGFNHHLTKPAELDS